MKQLQNERVVKVKWSECFPHEFRRRLAEQAVVYMPIGLCEPHGQISAFGLDSFKAEFICEETAKIAGGIVAPTMSYHVHESGPSAKWLETHIGETNPFMTSVSPAVFYHFFLYQLRSFYNAGFETAIIVSGHGGAHAEDLRIVSAEFAKYTSMNVWYGTDFDLSAGTYQGDHAGKYEISALMHIRPDLVDFDLRAYEQEPNAGGRFALADNATEATSEYGEQILQTCIRSLTLIIERLQLDKGKWKAGFDRVPLTYAQVEEIWRSLLASGRDWSAMRPRPDQPTVAKQSRWKQFEEGILTSQ